MNKVIKFDLSEQGIAAAIKELEAYQKWLQEKTKQLVSRLASIGVDVATARFSQAMYDNVNDAVVTAKRVSNNKYLVQANGESVLFIEFGAGIRYAASSHPVAGQYGMGVGTYPGQTHAYDEKGWWIPKERGGGHTYGNPAYAPMYTAEKYLEQELVRIVKEVFV